MWSREQFVVNDRADPWLNDITARLAKTGKSGEPELQIRNPDCPCFVSCDLSTFKLTSVTGPRFGSGNNEFMLPKETAHII